MKLAKLVLMMTFLVGSTALAEGTDFQQVVCFMNQSGDLHSFGLDPATDVIQIPNPNGVLFPYLFKRLPLPGAKYLDVTSDFADGGQRVFLQVRTQDQVDRDSSVLYGDRDYLARAVGTTEVELTMNHVSPEISHLDISCTTNF